MIMYNYLIVDRPIMKQDLRLDNNKHKKREREIRERERAGT